MSNLEEIKAQLAGLVEEGLKPVSYKWLARNNGLPANLSKQYLFAYAESRRGKVNVTYLLAGWTSNPVQHIIQLVGEDKLKEAKKKLEKVTSLHVYSIQPSQPKDPSDLWNAEVEQTNALFDQMVKKLESNCLSDNNLSSVYCAEAERDTEFAKQMPVPPQPEPEPKAKPKTGNSTISAKIDGIMAGRTANRGGVASTSVAVNGGEGEKTQGALTNGPASAPAALAKKAQGDGGKEARVAPNATIKSQPTDTQKGRGNALGSMWSKAPGKKEKPKIQAETAKAVDAEAALQARTEEDAEDSDDEEDFVPAQRTKAQANLLSDDEDDFKPTGGKKANANVPSKGGKASAKPIAQSKQGGGQKKGGQKSAAAKSQPKQAGQKRKSSTDQPETADTEADEEAGTQKDSQKPSQPKYGTVKAGEVAGAKRRKVQRTVINDDGEEVTEEVWEDTAVDGSKEDAINPSPNPSPDAENTDNISKSRQNSVRDSKPATGQKVQPDPKGKPSSPSKLAGSRKAVPAGKGKSGAAQKNIMSFFGKK